MEKSNNNRKNWLALIVLAAILVLSLEMWQRLQGSSDMTPFVIITALVLLEEWKFGLIQKWTDKQ